MILMPPREQLKSPAFASVPNDEQFIRRICLLGVDEVHLMNPWGKSFRKVFEEVGWMCTRISKHVLIIGATVTLQEGSATTRVRMLLHFQDRQSHIIRRSNTKDGIHVLFRTMKTGINSVNFHDLDWICPGATNFIVRLVNSELKSI